MFLNDHSGASKILEDVKNYTKEYKERYEYGKQLFLIKQDNSNITNIKNLIQLLNNSNISFKNYYLFFLLVKKLESKIEKIENTTDESNESKWEEIVNDVDCCLEITKPQMKKYSENLLLNSIDTKFRCIKINALMSLSRYNDCGKDIVAISQNIKYKKNFSAQIILFNFSNIIKNPIIHLYSPHYERNLYWWDDESKFCLDNQSRQKIISYSSTLGDSGDDEIKLDLYKKCIIFQQSPSIFQGLDILYSAIKFNRNLLSSLNLKKFAPYSCKFLDISYHYSLSSLSEEDLSNIELSFWISKHYGFCDQNGYAEMLLESNNIPYSMEFIQTNVNYLIEKI